MLLAGFLALQFNALGDGVACLLTASTGYAGAVSPNMAEMGMAAATSETGQKDASRSAKGSGAVPARSQSPCQRSNAPHSSCQSMTPCAAAFAITPAYGVTANVSVPSVRLAVIEVVPASRSLSPDLPPPKA